MSESKSKNQFYSLAKIDKLNAAYNLIIGERSNGKTYACLAKALRNYVQTKKQSAYIRRWKEDFRGKRGQQLFAGHESSGYISHITNGEYDRVRYYSSKWYLARYDEKLESLVYDETPFMFAFSLNDMEHDKSISYPDVTTCIFDEFLTRQYYLPDEFILFMNVLSTIIRHRDNVTIYMLGNTVNKYCPYFKEMGLKHIPEMEQGKIDLYHYGESTLTVAVELCESSAQKQGKKSDKYFAFDNPALSMITGGSWELALYPHLPERYEKSQVAFTYFIDFDDNLLQAEIITTASTMFTYIHDKTTPLKHPDTDLLFTIEPSSLPNHIPNILKSSIPITRKLLAFFKDGKVFYQDNEIGEIVNNYLKYCQQLSITKS